MKHLLFLIIACFFIHVNSSAQHLSIKGIEINGNPASFISKIKQQGFVSVPDETIDGATILKGTFAGHRNSYMLIEHSNNIVSQVVVILEGDNNWFDAKAKYLSLKSSYSEKYKVEPHSEEFFKNTEDETTGSAHIALEKEEAKYECTFYLENGNIMMLIYHMNVFQGNQLWNGVGLGGCYVIGIRYTDNINYEIQHKANLNDL